MAVPKTVRKKALEKWNKVDRLADEAFSAALDPCSFCEKYGEKYCIVLLVR
jgi:hypothetical protein